MSLPSRLFPDPPRAFAGQRWLNIVLRSLHLVGMAGVVAGVWFEVPWPAWRGYFWLTLCSGAALVAVAVWSSAIWFCQVRGVAVLLKLLMLLLLPALPDLAPALLWAVILLSGVVSHAPGRLRYALFCRRQASGATRRHAAPARPPARGVREDNPTIPG